MTFASFFYICVGLAVSDDWWPLPWVAPGLMGGEDSGLSVVTQGKLGCAIEEGYKGQGALWGRLILPRAQAEGFTEEVAFQQVLEEEKVALDRRGGE